MMFGGSDEVAAGVLGVFLGEAFGAGVVGVVVAFGDGAGVSAGVSAEMDEKRRKKMSKMAFPGSIFFWVVLGTKLWWI